MNKSIFLLLYLVCTWSLIICTCCSDRGTAERNLIFSHFLCLQLFGLGTRKQEFKSTWTTGIRNFGIERRLSGNHVVDCFFRLSFCLFKRNRKVGVRELQGGWLAGLGREFTWKLGKDTIKTQDGATLAPVFRKYWWCLTISVPLCVNKSETASWTLRYKLKTKFCVKVVFWTSKVPHKRFEAWLLALVFCFWVVCNEE